MAATIDTSSDAPKNLFRKEILVLKAFGLSIEGNESLVYTIYSFLIISIFSCGYPLVQFINLVKNNFRSDTQSMVYQVGTFVSMMKTFVVLGNRAQIRKILNNLQSEPFIADKNRGGDAEEKLIKECAFITTMQTFAYWISCFASVTVPTAYTLIKRLRSDDYHDWKLPFGPLDVLNTTHSPNYEISWFHQTVSVYCVAYHFATIDLICAAVLCHLCYQFKILHLNLRRIVGSSAKKIHKNTTINRLILSDKNSLKNEEVDGSALKWKYLKASLGEVLEYHLAILDIAEDMERVFSSLLLLIFLGTLAMLCFVVYRFSLLPANDPAIIRCVVDAINTAMQVLLVCFWGERVTHESLQVGQAAYDANFAGTDPKFQKGLVLIIRRSQDPVKLTAGKFSNIGLGAFAWIVRSTYSAAMMLRNINTQDV